MTGEGAPVAILIVTHQSARVLPECLESLPPAARGVECDVTVVDNASTDGTRELVEGWSRSPIRLLPSEGNRGYAAAINLGIRAHPNAGVIVVLNPDVRLDPNALRPLVEAARAPGGGIAVPRLRDEHGDVAPSLRRRPTPGRIAAEAVLGGNRAGRLGLGELVLAPERYEEAGPADWATGAALAISAACRAAVGPWDESFFLYSEETDYCLRAAAAGFSTSFEPAAGAVHLGGEAPTSAALWTLLVWNRFDLQRRRGRRCGALGWAGLMAGELLRSVAGPRASVHRRAVRGLLRPRVRPVPVSAGTPPATS